MLAFSELVYQFAWLSFISEEEFGPFAYHVAVASFWIPLGVSYLLAAWTSRKPGIAYYLVPPTFFAFSYLLLAQTGFGIEIDYPMSVATWVPSVLIPTLWLLACLLLFRSKVCYAGCLFAAAWIGSQGYPKPRPFNRELTVALVQTNFAASDYETPLGRAAICRSLLKEIERCCEQGPDLIVLPEQVVPSPGLAGSEFCDELIHLSLEYNSGILLGSNAWSDSPGLQLNGSYFFLNGGPWGPYVKKKLIYGAETSPYWMREHLPPQIGRLESKDWTHEFWLKDHTQVVPKICFDILDPLPAIEGSTIVALQGSTGFDSKGIVSERLLGIAEAQSLRSGYPVLAAINSGPSGIFTRGLCVGKIDKGRQGALITRIRF